MGWVLVWFLVLLGWSVMFLYKGFNLCGIVLMVLVMLVFVLVDICIKLVVGMVFLV